MASKVSVIMPVYDCEEFISEAIESILEQSFQNFEYIIVDDCSTDSSYSICEKYQKKDARIRLYKNDTNKGISYTRNMLIDLSKTNYIASQDADDISLYDRLELCYDFLEAHDSYAVVGGNNIIIDADSQILGKREYSNNIKDTILKKSPVSNPSSMFRKDVFRKLSGYNKELNYGEDYDLWLKFYAHGYNIKNLGQDLIKYRVHDSQSKKQKLKSTLKNTILIQKRAIEKYEIVPSLGDKGYHFLESLLVLFPNFLILFLFKKFEYKSAK